MFLFIDQMLHRETMALMFLLAIVNLWTIIGNGVATVYGMMDMDFGLQGLTGERVLTNQDPTE